MVVHHLRAHHVQQAVEALGGGALEEGVRLPAGAHAVDNFAPVQIGVHHIVHGVDVVLPVAVDADGDVALVHGLHQPGQHGVLMAPVAALGNAHKVPVLPGQIADDAPGVVPAAVVDKQHPALLADFPPGRQILQLLKEHGRGLGQYVLFIVAGHHDI